VAVGTVSFWLKSFAFLDQNSAVDLPPSPEDRHG
jgi:hypothetical protein